MRLYAIFAMLVFTLVLGGCLNSDTDGGSDPVSSGLSYYYDEFSDVAIPKEMSPQKKDTFITYSANGVKLGTQTFSGRVEIGSLVSAMQGYMSRDGWSLRSVLRATTSILIFERADRMCSVYISDGIIDTSMLIFVSPKIVDGALQYNVPTSTSTEPITSGDPIMGAGPTSTTSSSSPATNGNVTVYPSGGFSGGTSNK